MALGFRVLRFGPSNHGSWPKEEILGQYKLYVEGEGIRKGSSELPRKEGQSQAWWCKAYHPRCSGECVRRGWKFKTHLDYKKC